ncbi:D-methionine transport system ATP-binding protein [Marininema mesophilum]|uniref:D-methionine transport system ATP-binding protein n=1 Tax=Marininema mesophilum TaxID=1048340 RepID=A0A1H2TGP3_9BACL|nr:ATP-binding cassette domain-containing protein [Marininema mesophilum]SDW42990.1 D-methionine transport system ATP-binding protein [Marininema mesophilum]
MIHLKGIEKTYPSRSGSNPVSALTEVDLEIKAGEIYGIIGRSGAGKSTLLRLVNGLEAPSSGEVWVDEKEISRLGEKDLRLARTKIGIIFQHFNLLWSRTVWENVAFSLEVAGKSKGEIREKVSELLERVGLMDRAHAYPSQLSGGQKQRVGIARALANNPKVLLCDEATSALDPETTASILQLLRDIHRDTGITTLLITHEMSVVKSICQQVAVMDGGRIIEQGRVADVFKNPTHPVTKQFVRQTENEEVADADTVGTVVHVRFRDFASAWKRLSEESTARGVHIRVLAGSIKPSEAWTFDLEGGRENVAQILDLLKETAVETEVIAGVQ